MRCVCSPLYSTLSLPWFLSICVDIRSLFKSFENTQMTLCLYFFFQSCQRVNVLFLSRLFHVSAYSMLVLYTFGLFYLCSRPVSYARTNLMPNTHVLIVCRL